MFVFQPVQDGGFVQVIDDVVEITVGNEIVTDLTDPITIDFYHNIIEVSLLVLCVFVPNCSLEHTHIYTPYTLMYGGSYCFFF